MADYTDYCVVECSSYRGGSRGGGYRPGPPSYGGGGEGNADRLVDQLQELVGVLAYVSSGLLLSSLVMVGQINDRSYE